MGFILLLLLAVFLLVLFVSLTLWLVYWVPTYLGYRKTGLVLASLVGCLCLALAILLLFEDQLFTKSEAADLLAQQDLRLRDRFDLVENKSMAGIGDYYHTFTLQISTREKDRLIGHIRQADNFAPKGGTVPDITHVVDAYTGPSITQNYETERAFIRKLYKPVGPGYAPTYRVITIPKEGTKLVFEDIDN